MRHWSLLHSHTSINITPTLTAAQQVLTVFQERRIMADETTKFEELLAHERERFVEEELRERSISTTLLQHILTLL
jgi:hypothetical protein